MNFSDYMSWERWKVQHEKRANKQKRQTWWKRVTSAIARGILRHKGMAMVAALLFLILLATAFHVHRTRRMEFQSYSFIVGEFLEEARHIHGMYRWVSLLLDDIIASEYEPTLAAHQEVLGILGDTVDRQYALLWRIHTFFHHFSVPYHGRPLPWSSYYMLGRHSLLSRVYDTTLSRESYLALQAFVQEKMLLFEEIGLTPDEIGFTMATAIEDRRTMWYAIGNVSNFALRFIENEKQFGLALDAIQ